MHHITNSCLCVQHSHTHSLTFTFTCMLMIISRLAAFDCLHSHTSDVHIPCHWSSHGFVCAMPSHPLIHIHIHFTHWWSYQGSQWSLTCVHTHTSVTSTLSLLWLCALTLKDVGFWWCDRVTHVAVVDNFHTDLCFFPFPFYPLIFIFFFIYPFIFIWPVIPPVVLFTSCGVLVQLMLHLCQWLIHWGMLQHCPEPFVAKVDIK